MKKNISFLLVLLSLLFNIQLGFTHDIEHQYHDDAHHDEGHHDDAYNKNLIECEDCTFTVTDHSAKTTNFSSKFDFSFDQSFQINDNYLVKDTFFLGTAAYQSQAP
ncbi:hypothetical protein ABXT54_02615 [Methylophilaceae bacterium Uisw_099_01]